MAEHVDESTVEQAAKEWFGELGYTVGYAPHDAPVGARAWGAAGHIRRCDPVAKGAPGPHPAKPR